MDIAMPLSAPHRSRRHDEAFWQSLNSKRSKEENIKELGFDLTGGRAKVQSAPF